MKTRLLSLLLALALAFALGACALKPAEPAPEPEAEAPEAVAPEPEPEPEPEPVLNDKLVGISMPAEEVKPEQDWLYRSPRFHNSWEMEGNQIKQQLEAEGYEVDLRFAGDDPAIQAAQLENMIGNGTKVLVIRAIDGDALLNVLARAKEAGCTVIAYDRLIMSSDAVSCFVTFDNWLVGVKQGEYIRDALELDNRDGPFNIEYIISDPGDWHADFFYEGAMSVLQPYIDAGKLVTLSGQTEKTGIATVFSSSEGAQSRFENILSTYYTDKPLHAVLATRDSLAQGVAAALENTYENDVYPIITGQDCDIVSVKNILEGRQAMSILKDTRILADRTAMIADAFMKGAEPPFNDTETYDNGTGIIPSYLCDPTVVTKDNIQETLIDPGYFTWEELGQ